MYHRSYRPRQTKLQQHAGGPRGFTLLEVLVAIIIMAVIMTTAFGALRLGSRSWEAGIERAGVNETFRAVADLLQRQLSQTIPMTWPDEAKNRIVFEGTPGQMRFVAPAPQGYRQAGMFEYGLTIRTEGLDTQLVLSYVPFSPGAGEFRAPASDQQMLLLEKLKDVSFDYYGSPVIAGAPPGVKEQPPRWQQSWDADAQNFPDLVRLRIEVNEGQPPWPELYLPLPADRSP